jgi:hypothetical protein
MLKEISNENILFLDIETVPQYPSYNESPEIHRQLWSEKAAHLKADDKTPEELYNRAGIYAEFGKIVCISAGFFAGKQPGKLRIRSYYGHDEKKLISEFFTMLRSHFNGKNQYLCAHNGKEFDFPFICRRAVINRLEIPDILNIQGKKPWETLHLDTMELWKFGDYKHYTSLKLLAAIFGIPSPKDDIAGDQVYSVYYNEKDLKRIAVYCEKDVLTVAQLLLCYKFQPLLDSQNIEFCLSEEIK